MDLEEYRREEKARIKNRRNVAFVSMVLIMFGILIVMFQISSVTEEHYEERQDMVDGAAGNGRLPPKSALDTNYKFEERLPLYILVVVLGCAMIIPAGYLIYLKRAEAEEERFLQEYY